MSPASNDRLYYAWGTDKNREALLEAMSIHGLDEEIALLRLRLRQHLAEENPDEGMVLAWINTLARTLLAKARIEGADPTKTRKQVAEVIRELGSIFLEDPAQ